MMRKLCLLAALLILSLGLSACTKVQARIKIREANEAYEKEQYEVALKKYDEARRIDPSFPDLDRLIGYANIGLYQPENNTPANLKHADTAIVELQKYLKKRPTDMIARDALINLFLNANRTDQAIDYFKEYLKAHPADLNAVKSIATLVAKQGDFNEARSWYRKITLLDASN